MKNILCYGDSNTWGYNPSSPGERYDYSVRWTGRLQTMLGEGYRVIEAGISGRTTVFDDPITPDRNGRTTLNPVLEMARPLDLVILMLGTNDTKIRLTATARDITNGLAELIKGIRVYPYVPPVVPEILVIAPMPIRDCVNNMPFGETFGDSGIKKSFLLAEYYEVLARDMGCRFVDASQWGQASDVDGIHMSPETHRNFAEGVYAEVKRILG